MSVRPVRTARAGIHRRFARPSIEALESRRLLALFTYTVTSTANDGSGTLRDAIRQCNLQPAADTCLIDFDIAPGGGQTIALQGRPLDAITHPLTLDATTQSGYVDAPLVMLDGSAVNGNGLTITAGNTVVKGLAVVGFSRTNSDGILIRDGGGNVIVDCYLGVDLTGSNRRPNFNGLEINQSSNNRIGLDDTGPRGNVISGNSNTGVLVTGSGSTGNQIVANLVGTDKFGINAVANTAGVVISGAGQNTVGGVNDLDLDGSDLVRRGNLISGNTREGILLTTGSSGNTLLGNRIGTDVRGAFAIPNLTGVSVNASAGNTVGDVDDLAAGDSFAGNLISGNRTAGLQITGASATGNVVRGNFIGTNLAGVRALANGLQGISISGAPGNTIGGRNTYSTDGTIARLAGNVVSGNGSDGVFLKGVNSSVITGPFNGNALVGNLIGTDATGMNPIGNLGNGIALDDSAFTAVGGTTLDDRNVVAQSTRAGISLTGENARSNTIQLNYIGTNVLGDDTTRVGNSGDGVFLGDASDNTVGGFLPDGRPAGNLISGNRMNGVEIAFINTYPTGNEIQANRIGTTAAGSAPLPNERSGVVIASTYGNTVGGTTEGSGNLISGNLEHGVRLISAGGNCVAANLIGTDANGTFAVGNGLAGIDVVGRFNPPPDAVANGCPVNGGNTIGGTNEVNADRSIARRLGNVVSGNRTSGVKFEADGSGVAPTDNVVTGNLIGTDRTGLRGLGNFNEGVLLSSAVDNTIGGVLPGAANVISANRTDGIAMIGGAQGNTVLGNRIGTDATATVVGLGNGANGVSLVNAPGNKVGTRAPGGGNVISGNGSTGVLVKFDPNAAGNADGNVIQQNLIGIGLGGGAPVPASVPIANTLAGIFLSGAVRNTQIGGDSLSAGNVIGANTYGVLIGGSQGSAPSLNVLKGNLIGTDPTGLLPISNTAVGVLILNYAFNNQVGGTAPGSRNVISGNGVGLAILTTAHDNVVQGNFVGLDATGSSALPNRQNGLSIRDSTGNLIGGASPGAGNVISGNGTDGLNVGEAGGTKNVIQNNFIGTDATGFRPVGNTGEGVLISDAPGNLFVGNVISANRQAGIQVVGSGATGNTIQGNRIGTDRLGGGSGGMGNSGDGIYVNNAPGNRVGADLATTPGGGNLISRNGRNGVQIFGQQATGNVVLGNLIGTDPSGAVARGNLQNGVLINAAPGNQVGGSSASAGNVISANGVSGISVVGSTATGNLLAGNLIGTNLAGTSALGNRADGVTLNDAPGNVIGGTLGYRSNVISGNDGSGIRTTGAVHGTRILGNRIGTDRSGTRALGNGVDGIQLADTGGVTVGGGKRSGPESNVISGNRGAGVHVSGSGTVRDSVVGNLVGTDVTGRVALANNIGVLIDGVSGVTVVGNLVSANLSVGVDILGATATGNVVTGNLIGTDITGTRPLLRPGATGDQARQYAGVLISDGSSNVVGGSSASQRNLISGNVAGVVIALKNATGNRVLGNFIGTDVSGTKSVGNQTGVYINGAPQNVIGGPSPGARNVISGNSSQGGTSASTGVYIFGRDATSNVVQGNFIGVDATGKVGVKGPNGQPIQSIGVFVNLSASNTIGGSQAGQGNTISGNLSTAVYLLGVAGSRNVGSFNNVIAGNRLGPAAASAGNAPAPGNGEYGVLLFNAAMNTVVRSGPGQNMFANNGIANVREFTGGPTVALGSRTTSAAAVPTARTARALARRSSSS